jgi:hypothetical protein
MWELIPVGQLDNALQLFAAKGFTGERERDIHTYIYNHIYIVNYSYI